MSISTISGTRKLLKPWAMEHAKRHALLRNIEIAAFNQAVMERPVDPDSTPAELLLEDPIEVEDLFHSGGRDEGTFVVWEVQDGAGWCVTVSADFTTGKVTVEG